MTVTPFTLQRWKIYFDFLYHSFALFATIIIYTIVKNLTEQKLIDTYLSRLNWYAID